MAEEREAVAADYSENALIVLKQYSVFFWYVVRDM